MKNANDPYAVAYNREDAKEAIFRNYELGYFNTGTNMNPSLNDEIIVGAIVDGKRYAMHGIIDRAFTDAEKLEAGHVSAEGDWATYPTFWAMWDSAPVEIETKFACTQGGNIRIDDRLNIWNELTGENRKPAKVLNKIAVEKRKAARVAKRVAKEAAAAAKIAAKKVEAQKAIDVQLYEDSCERDYYGYRDGDVIINTENNGRFRWTQERFLMTSLEQMIEFIRRPKVAA